MAVLVGWDSAPGAAGEFASVTTAIGGFEGAGANGRENGTPATASFFFDSIYGVKNADFRLALYEAATRELVAYTAIIDAAAVSYDVVVTEPVTSVKDVVSGTAYMIAAEREDAGDNLIFRKEGVTTTAGEFTINEGGTTSGYAQDLTSPPPDPLPADDGATGANQNPFYIWFSASSTPEIRKSSTFDIETTLADPVTTATLDGTDVFDHVTGQTGDTVSFEGAATDEITTSGEYTLTLGDGTDTQDITVQVNVVGLASDTLKKDGGILADLTDVEYIVMTGAAGSRVVNQNDTGRTSNASGETSALEVSDTALSADDPVFVLAYSDSEAAGIPFSTTLELI